MCKLQTAYVVRIRDWSSDVGSSYRRALADMDAEGLHTAMIPPLYRTPYFRHSWSNCYSAGYYAYIWTEMLAHDGWDWVEKHGGMTRANSTAGRRVGNEWGRKVRTRVTP